MKIISIALLAGIVLVGCSAKEKETEQQNQEIAKSMFEAFSRHDWKAMAEHYADSAHFLDPSLGKEYVHQSHGQIITKYGEMENVFPDIRDEIVGMYSSGDKVIVEFVSTGTAITDKGEQTSFRLPISSVLTIHDGKIVRDATYYDN